MSNSITNVLNLIKAKIPISWVLTYEENKLINEIRKKISEGKLKKQLFTWSCTSGMEKNFSQDNLLDGPETGPILKALKFITEYKSDDSSVSPLFILRDMHINLVDSTARALRDIYSHLIENDKNIIIVSPYLGYQGGTGVHPLLEKQVTVVEYDLPNKEEVTSRVSEIIKITFSPPKIDKKNSSNAKCSQLSKYIQEKEKKFTPKKITEITNSLQGLTLEEIDNIMSLSLSTLEDYDPEFLYREKKQIVKKNGILEFIDTSINIEEVGGLDKVKQYVTKYTRAFSDEAQAYGVEPLRGILFTGIPGTGKSLISKSLSKIWKLPLLRLDVGKCMGQLVGSSEMNMRSALSTACAIAPAILWIDEIEKGLSGTESSGRSDGGTTARVFGTLLTAMQEGLKDIVIVATANNIHQLPSELIRRFNEVFFVDLPTACEREEIFRIHLSKKNRNLEKFKDNLQDMLEASEGFTGAEIEKVVKDAIAASFYDESKDVEIIHILTALNETKPISKVQSEQIKAMQTWATDHARYASSFSEKKNKKSIDNTEEKKTRFNIASN